MNTMAYDLGTCAGQSGVPFGDMLRVAATCQPAEAAAYYVGWRDGRDGAAERKRTVRTLLSSGRMVITAEYDGYFFVRHDRRGVSGPFDSDDPRFSPARIE